MDLFDPVSSKQVIVDGASEVVASVARSLPIVLAVVVGVLVAWLVSAAAAWICARALRRMGLDRASERLSVTSLLRRGGAAREPSALVARVVFWGLFLALIASIVERLGLKSVSEIADRVIGYVPNLIAAVVILVAGLVLGRIARNVVMANLGGQSRVGPAVQGGAVVAATVIALEQLGVDTQLLVLVITVVVAATGTTMGIAFALGARPVVTHILAGHFLRRSLVPGATVDVLGRRGQVERVGQVETTFRDGERASSIPNARLIDEIVEK